MIFMGQAEEYELDIVPPKADTCTPCSLLNNFRVCLFAPAQGGTVSRLTIECLKSRNLEM